MKSLIDLIGPRFVTPLSILGKYDWVKFHLLADSHTFCEIELNIPDDPKLSAYKPELAFFYRAILEDDGVLSYQYSISKSLAFGPKLLRPNSVNCEALEHVTLQIAFDDYQQPYPTVIIEIPKEYREKISKRFELESPDCVVIHHEEKSKHIVSTCVWPIKDDGTISTRLLSPYRNFNTLEEALVRTTSKFGKGFVLADLIHRLAINFCMMMTLYGVNERGPLCPKQKKQLLRDTQRKKSWKAKRAKKSLKAEFDLIEFDQHIKFFDRPGSKDGNQGAAHGSHRPHKPHWRRGFFRRQRHGKKFSKTKVVYICPVLVNGRFFKGDLSKTKVTYESCDTKKQDHGRKGGSEKK